jgi:hypothetical protein
MPFDRNWQVFGRIVVVQIANAFTLSKVLSIVGMHFRVFLAPLDDTRWWHPQLRRNVFDTSVRRKLDGFPQGQIAIDAIVFTRRRR